MSLTDRDTEELAHRAVDCLIDAIHFSDCGEHNRATFAIGRLHGTVLAAYLDPRNANDLAWLLGQGGGRTKGFPDAP